MTWKPSRYYIDSSKPRAGPHIHRRNEPRPDVLVVDLDPQGCLTFSLGHNPDKLEQSVHDVLVGGVETKDVLLDTAEGMSLLPATIDLAGAEAMLLMKPGREYTLKRALASVEDDYDVVVIDCPPSLGVLTLNGLTAAQAVFPDTDYFSLHAQVDADHFRLGYELLESFPALDIAPLRGALTEGWQMMNMICQRINDIAEGGDAPMDLPSAYGRAGDLGNDSPPELSMAPAAE